MAASAPIFVTFVSAIVHVLQELPYHLERLLDNNRLIRCLMDWEVFDRMYSEEFSIDLLHSWRQVVICLSINLLINSLLFISKNMKHCATVNMFTVHNKNMVQTSFWYLY